MLSYEQSLNRAAALCSASEHCPQEIHEKALKWGLSEEDAARLITRLIDERFIDERRYAHAFVNDKYRFQHWGCTKIRYALRHKGISAAAIDEAIEETIDNDQYLTDCIELLRHRMKGMATPLAQNDRARLYRFAAQRGFEPHVISRALSQCNIDTDD